MIQNDKELKVTQERIAYFYNLLEQLRVTTPAEMYPSLSSGYIAEIERMHKEVLEYLKQHSSETTPAEAA
jgi:hypothetical protein